MRADAQEPGWIADLSDFNPLIDPAVDGEYEITLKDGSTHKAYPVWELWAKYLEQWTPAKTSEVTGIDADKIEKACLAWATRVDPSIPNGGINYGLGVEHAGNSTENCRAIMAACAMVGAIDTPGGQRGATNGWTGAGDMCSMLPSMAALAYLPAPELSMRMCGNEKMPLLYWYNVWADCNSVMEAAHQEPDAPYQIHGGMIGSGDHMDMCNATYNWEALNKLDFLFEANLWHSATSGAAARSRTSRASTPVSTSMPRYAQVRHRRARWASSSSGCPAATAIVSKAPTPKKNPSSAATCAGAAG